MFEAMNVFGSITIQFRTLFDKMATNTSNYEALQKEETELDILFEAIQKHTQDYDTRQLELTELH